MKNVEEKTGFEEGLLQRIEKKMGNCSPEKYDAYKGVLTELRKTKAVIKGMIRRQHYHPAMPDIGIKKPYYECPVAGGNDCSCSDLKDVLKTLDSEEAKK